MLFRFAKFSISFLFFVKIIFDLSSLNLFLRSSTMSISKSLISRFVKFHLCHMKSKEQKLSKLLVRNS